MIIDTQFSLKENGGLFFADQAVVALSSELDGRKEGSCLLEGNRWDFW